MRGGLAVGIPLTLLQTCLVPEAHITPIDVVNNFAVAEAIYTADRLDTPWYAMERLPTRVAAVVSSAYYASEPSTALLVPLVLVLHTSYSSLKTTIAPVKPFFVACMWTLAIYYVPLLRAHLHLFDDVLTPAWMTLSIAGLSHAADVVDIEDDRKRDLHTPAVQMGKPEASFFVIATLLASNWLHCLSPSSFVLYDIASAAFGLALLAEDAAVGIALFVLCTAAYVSHYDLDIAGRLLKATEIPHDASINLIVDMSKSIESLPAPLQKNAFRLLSHVVQNGDRVGGQIVEWYLSLLFKRL